MLSAILKIDSKHALGDLRGFVTEELQLSRGWSDRDINMVAGRGPCYPSPRDPLPLPGPGHLSRRECGQVWKVPLSFTDTPWRGSWEGHPDGPNHCEPLGVTNVDRDTQSWILPLHPPSQEVQKLVFAFPGAPTLEASQRDISMGAWVTSLLADPGLHWSTAHP